MKNHKVLLMCYSVQAKSEISRSDFIIICIYSALEMGGFFL